MTSPSESQPRTSASVYFSPPKRDIALQRQNVSQRETASETTRLSVCVFFAHGNCTAKSRFPLGINLSRLVKSADGCHYISARFRKNFPAKHVCKLHIFLQYAFRRNLPAQRSFFPYNRRVFFFLRRRYSFALSPFRRGAQPYRPIIQSVL